MNRVKDEDVPSRAVLVLHSGTCSEGLTARLWGVGDSSHARQRQSALPSVFEFPGPLIAHSGASALQRV